jgi:hypothetical protein
MTPRVAHQKVHLGAAPGQRVGDDDNHPLHATTVQIAEQKGQPRDRPWCVHALGEKRSNGGRGRGQGVHCRHG